MTHDTTDLTNYYTGSQVDSKLNDYLSKTDAGNNYYNKSEVDKKLTAASQHSSPGIFINRTIKHFSCSNDTQTYTTTEKCYALFSISADTYTAAAVVSINYVTTNRVQNAVFGLYLNSGINCSFTLTEATFFSLTN